MVYPLFSVLEVLLRHDFAYALIDVKSGFGQKSFYSERNQAGNTSGLMRGRQIGWCSKAGWTCTGRIFRVPRGAHGWRRLRVVGKKQHPSSGTARALRVLLLID